MVFRKETVHFSRKAPLGKGCKKERWEGGLRALWTELEGLPILCSHRTDGLAGKWGDATCPAFPPDLHEAG